MTDIPLPPRGPQWTHPDQLRPDQLRRLAVRRTLVRLDTGLVCRLVSWGGRNGAQQARCESGTGQRFTVASSRIVDVDHEILGGPHG